MTIIIIDNIVHCFYTLISVIKIKEQKIFTISFLLIFFLFHFLNYFNLSDKLSGTCSCFLTFSIKFVPISNPVSISILFGFINEIKVVENIGVNCWTPRDTATNSPGNQSNYVPSSRNRLADQWGTPVSRASIFSRLTSRTQLKTERTFNKVLPG